MTARVRSLRPARWSSISLNGDRPRRKNASSKSRFTKPRNWKAWAYWPEGLPHDFNNLLMGVMGNADLALMDLPPGASALPYVEGHQDGRRASCRAHQPDAGLLRQGEVRCPEHSPFRAHRRDGPSAEAVRKQEGRNPVRSGSWFALIHADASQARQVVMNLIINASESHWGRGRGHHA